MWTGLATTFAIGYIYGEDTPFSKQLPSFDILRQTSVLIFGVVGAWLAVLFPMVHSHGDSQKNAQELTCKLFKPITSSLYIITYSLVIPLLVPFMKKYAFIMQFSTELRGLSFASLCVATTIQIYTLLLALQPFDILKTQTELSIEKKACDARHKDNVRRYQTTDKNPE